MAGAARSRARAVRLSRKRARSRARTPARAVQKGHRLRLVHARRRLHRLGRGSPGLGRGASKRRAEGTRARSDRQHRDRPGHQHDLRADRRRRARHRLRRRSTSCSPTPPSCPNSGPTVASRTCMVVGKLVETAALGLKHALDRRRLPAGRATRARSSRRACRDYIARSSGRCARPAQYQAAAGTALGRREVSGRRVRHLRLGGVRRGSVASTLTTFETRVDDFVAVQEVGKVINPVLAAGQIEGGVAQGIGWALYENVVWREGRMANAQMTNYIMPTSMDLPPIRVFFEEMPYPHGPAARRASASCRWTARRRRSSTRSRTRPASIVTRAAADAGVADGRSMETARG